MRFICKIPLLAAISCLACGGPETPSQQELSLRAVPRASALTTEDVEWKQIETTLTPTNWTSSLAVARRGSSVVLFCGETCTWEWDGTVWLKMEPAHSPQDRAGSSMATFGDQAILYGGSFGDVQSTDTWEWDGADWTLLSTATSPTPGAGGIATFGDKVILFGGWSWEDGGHAMNETWEWSGTAWIQRSPSHVPPARSDQKMAELGSVLVMFGGLSDTSLTPLDDTWEWNGTDWIEKTPEHRPSARFLHGMATIGNSIIMFGGTNGSAIYADTWEWNGADWQVLALTDGPVKRQAFGMTSLGVSAAILHGGSNNSAGDIEDTWVFNVKSLGLALGATCENLGDCASQHCVDGVCCNESCQEACETCNAPGSPGQCAPDPEEHDCGLFPQGASCLTDRDCNLLFCVDGVCCADLCADPCDRCNVAGSEGQCTALSEAECAEQGQDPGVVVVGKGCACQSLAFREPWLVALAVLLIIRTVRRRNRSIDVTAW